MNKFSPTPFENILALWPAPCGLYMVFGVRDMICSLEQLIVDYHKKLGPLYWIDSGNCFDAYQITKKARDGGVDPHELLRFIKVARPFTAFQFQQMLGKIPDSEQRPLVVISDLLTLFYDPDLQDADCKRIFQEFLTKLMRLKRRAVVLSLVFAYHAPAERKRILSRLMPLANYVVNGTGTFSASNLIENTCSVNRESAKTVLPINSLVA